MSPTTTAAAMTMKTNELIEKDRKYLWHPFTQMRDWQTDEVLVIEKGDGCYLIDTEGRRYLDGVSSLWCNVHGHCVEAIDKAVKKQLGKIAHSTFLGLTHPTAIELAEKLIAIAPGNRPDMSFPRRRESRPGSPIETFGDDRKREKAWDSNVCGQAGNDGQRLSRVFYSDSGSEAMEIALKMAFQYWAQTGKPGKKRFAKLTNAYHGDTIGSVSLGGIDLFHQIYQPLLFETFAVPSPYTYRWPSGGNPGQVMEESLKAMEKVFQEHHKEIAALIMEPLMQGAAGMIDQPRGYISRAWQLTEKYNILLIFDEVATGFGRTGKMFAAEHENVTPDIMAVAKGLTGGYLPLAATLTTEKVYEAFLGKYEEFKTFFHGHTFTANPLACAAAVANLRLFEKQKTIEKLQAKINFLKNRLQDFYALSCVGDIRQVGMMIGIELVRDKRTREMFLPEEKIGVRVIEKARKKGAILRPLGSVIVLMPPLAMTLKQLSRLCDITYQSIKEVTE